MAYEPQSISLVEPRDASGEYSSCTSNLGKAVVSSVRNLVPKDPSTSRLGTLIFIAVDYG